MSCKKCIPLFLVLGLLLGAGLAQAQKPPGTPTIPPPVLTGAVRPDGVATRKATVQQQLATLGQANLPKEALEATRASLEQLLQVLTSLEDALQRRTAYIQQLEALPQRLHELAVAQQALETRAPPSWPKVTEQLRDEYAVQVQTVQAELHELNQQTAAGEVRIAAIAKELEQLAEDRLQLDKELLIARGQGLRTGEHQPTIDVEIVELKLQLAHAEDEALEAEREWLTKRAPLQDALLSLTQVRHKLAQQALDTIQQSLSAALDQEQNRLSSTATAMEHQLEQTFDPAEAVRLTVHLQTVDMRKATAEYRHQLNLLGDDLLSQEQRNTQVKQDVERLTSLVEKYASGEGIAQRLLLAFERLRRERLRYSDAPVKALEARIPDPDGPDVHPGRSPLRFSPAGREPHGWTQGRPAILASPATGCRSLQGPASTGRTEGGFTGTATGAGGAAPGPYQAPGLTARIQALAGRQLSLCPHQDVLAA
jgi:hypothetical protein